MSAHDDQWPMAATRDVAPVIVRAAAENKQHVIELRAMLKRATHHMASLALLDVDAEVKRTALAFCNEAKALLRRTGGDR